MSDYGFLVVARHRTGRVVRGRTADFRPGRSYFLVIQEDGTPARVAVEDLKALFFVKSLFGDHRHHEKKTFRFRRSVGRKVWVEFEDGEELAGWTVSTEEPPGGFFLFPTDPSSNIEKVWVMEESTRRVLFDEEAERAALDYEEEGRARGRRRNRQAGPDRWDELLGLKPEDYRHGPSASGPGRASRRRSSGIFLGDW
jgi:hypothetical protein